MNRKNIIFKSVPSSERKRLKQVMLVLATVFFITSCQEPVERSKPVEKVTINLQSEKDAILHTLNAETKAAFQRDYDGWQEKWVHDPNMAKTYIDFPEDSFTEAIGWEEISGFVKTFFEKHPEPEPVPALLDSIDVRLYGNGAWVTYEQQDSLRGRKRETRLMEKVDGQWKIAGMHTTIYGFETQE